MSLRSRLDPFELPNREFRKLFRLTKELYQNLVGELTPHQHLYFVQPPFIAPRERLEF
jgi:hypothetical protein